MDFQGELFEETRVTTGTVIGLYASSDVVGVAEFDYDTKTLALGLLAIVANPQEVIECSIGPVIISIFRNSFNGPAILGSSKPTCIVVPSKSARFMHDAISSFIETTKDAKKKGLKSSLLSPNRGRSLLSKINLLNEQPNTSYLDRTRDHRFEGLVNLNSEDIMSACSALFSEVEVEGLLVNRVQEFLVKSYLAMDLPLFESLQIIESSGRIQDTVDGTPKPKTLFSLFDQTVTSIGKKRLRSIFLRPITSMEELTRRQEIVNTFLMNAVLRKNLQQLIRGFESPVNALKSMEQGQHVLGEWISIYNAIVCGISVLAEVKHLPEIYAVVTKMIPHLKNFGLGSQILRTINFDESKDLGRITLQHGIDDRLDESKAMFNDLDRYLEKVWKPYSQLSPGNLTKLVYLPQLGYYVMIPSMRNQDLEVALSLDYKFHTNDGCYYKHETTIILDNSFGDLYYDIIERETGILDKLQEAVLLCKEEFHLLEIGVAELDTFLSLAEAACMYELTRPHLSDDIGIQIEEGRNLVIQMNVDTYIPNNTHLIPNREGAFQLLTGPNGSGKSVYLRQVAQIVYLAHIGSNIPAKAAKIGLCDRIIGRIQSRNDSNIVDRSSFALDCNKMARILSQATPKTLCLVDEFGKGTLARDGASVAAAVIQSLVDRRDLCPMVIMSTHFSEILSIPLIKNQENLQMATMDVTFQDNPTSSTIHFLYRIKPGFCSSSFGDYCASLAGIPSEIIDRSAVVARLQASNSLCRSMDCQRIDARLDAELRKITRLSPEGEISAAIENIFTLL